MALFSPTFGGNLTIRTPSAEFLDRFNRRIADGLLTGRPHWRSRYLITLRRDDELTFRADDLLTAINVGLNHVQLRIPQDQRIEYLVSFRRWATYVVALCGMIGAAGVAGFFFLPTMREEIERDGAAIFWGMLLFWGVVWPWVLIEMHKRFAKRLLHRVIEEVDTQSA